ncbi:helix-turn-helix domain-containing protein [Chryseobacterium sp. MA9]|uniref:helix-turn-helix domain-containing protein n=1 Tax=Chryseobacterium sp. MA9 TaxID=2966625 RepID=UPI0021049D32|nr:helix-turn-helix domain-containing protein [Chryseobacterium sp. MA9]UTX47169.1 helix-turn-helix domain-containing protein [Chryseobacterium sp. MA9]
MKELTMQIQHNIFEELVENIKITVQEELEKIKESLSYSKDEELFYTLEQTAKILGIGKQALYGMNSRNEIPYCKRGKKCFYLKVDILNYIQEGRIKSKSEIEKEAQQALLSVKPKNRSHAG